MVEDGKFKCPLCNSNLTETRYYEIVGVWDAKKKFEEDLKKQLATAKIEREKLESDRKKLVKDQVELKKKLEDDFEKRKSLLIKKTQEDANKIAKKEIEKAKKQGLEEGVIKQKKKFDATSKQLEQKVKELGLKDEKIKELQKQLKEGRTSQEAGLDFEKELFDLLCRKFPEDRIEHKGHVGDILHYIVCEGKEIACIVYECKKTEKFSKDFITQIKNDVIERNARYGVLVTFASDKKQSHFWVENDILIVHPFGAPYLAEVLRKNLIQLYSANFNAKELDERAKKLLEYIKGNKFRNSIKDNIILTKELNDLLEKEVQYHTTIWKKRQSHYTTIAQHSKEIEKESNDIIGEDLGEGQLQIEVKPKKKKKIEYNNY
jgi:hypothetical protein